MWDLNGSPDWRNHEESEGKAVGSASNSSSSAAVFDDGEDVVDGDGNRTTTKKTKKRSSKIFGFCVTHDDDESMEDNNSDEPAITRQLMPVEEETNSGPGPGPTGLGFPRAQWVGLKFQDSEGVAASATTKKSRRGPRSRSSQYRGVTFYRRTGRWESHIWSETEHKLICFQF